MKISPFIIVKDASKTIALTLESLKWFDEVIVYDTGSCDKTIEITSRYNNVKLYHGPFSGFGTTKNMGAQFTTNNWVLSIDADEVISPELLNSIQNLQPKESTVYRFRRINIYRNKRICFSGWGNEYVKRIYNKNQVRFNEKLVHEDIESGDTEIITLDGELLHFSYHSISDFIKKRDLYSELFAMENKGTRKSSPLIAFISGTFSFLNTFLLKMSLFDGYRGLLIAVSEANVSFYKYLKLYEANIGNDKKLSLIINANHNCELLKYTLESILFQIIPPYEIIVSYDGLKDGYVQSIDEFEKISFVPVIHFSHGIYDHHSSRWIENVISISNCDYLIFVDSGAILDKYFIYDHSKNAAKGLLIKGTSRKLNDILSFKISNSSQKSNFLLHKANLRNKLSDLLMHFTYAFLPIKVNHNFNLSGTGNFSVYKEDITDSNLFLQRNNHIQPNNEIQGKDINSKNLKVRELKFKGILYELSSLVKGNKKSERPNVLVCLDRLKYLNCGLGQVSLNLGRKLIEKNTANLNLNFLLPANGFSEFDYKIQSIKLTLFRALFPGYMKRYELCHITHQLPGYNFGGAKKNLLTIHDLNFIFTKSSIKAKRYHNKLQQNVNKSDAIVFISEFTRQICYKYLTIPENKKVRIIYNGVEPPAYNTMKPDWLLADKYLFSIGQFLEKKNFHVLIPFIKLLPENISLVIAGENETNYGHRIKSLIAENKLEDRVILPGGISQEHKNYLFHHCHAFVFPSVAEGFGLPVIEAMMCKKPVFSSDRTSLKEIGGDFAFFWTDFEPNDMLEVFNRGIEIFYKSNHAEMQLEYANTYSYERNVNEYLNLYNEMLDQK